MGLLHVGISIVFLALCVPGLLWLGKKKQCSRRLWLWLLLFLCCVLGYGRMRAYLSVDQGEYILFLAKGKPVTVYGTVRRIAGKEKHLGLTLTECSLVWDEAAYKMPDMLVYVERETFQTVDEKGKVRLGMQISVRGKPEKPSEVRNPGEFDFREYYKALGISYQMFGERLEVSDRRYYRYRDGLYRMRLEAARVLEEICEPQDVGIFKAAVLGDKTSLEEDVRDLYQRNGIAHLLAISGLHISMVGLGIYRICRRLGLSYGNAGLLGVAVVVSYGILTGGSSSVVRAVMMVLFYLLAEYLGRSYDMLSAAALACVLLLWDSPGLLTQAGFQLSFGAVAAIGGVGPWMAERLEVTGNREKTIVLGVSVQMVACPVILYHFYQYPAYGIFLNLAVIPLMAYVIVSGIAGIILGFIYLPAGVAAVGSGHYILEFYLQLCWWGKELPGANLVMGRPGMWQIGLYTALLAALLWITCVGMREKVGRFQRQGVLASGVIICFLVMWQIPVKGVEVTFLDVGQGDGVCIRTKNAVILVDGGSSDKKRLGKNTMEPYLKSLGISQVDYAVVSHAHLDHISGLLYLLKKNGDIRIRNLVLPWLGREDESYKYLVELMKLHGGSVHWMREGERIGVGDMSLTCLYHGDERKKRDRNEHSLMLQLEYGGTRILLTGDMSIEGERDMMVKSKMDLKRCFLLKVAHHGSKYSGCEEFLKQSDPEWAVISCGEGNFYGHPHSDALERLSNQGTKILITKDTGAITVGMEGEQTRIQTFLP